MDQVLSLITIFLVLALCGSSSSGYSRNDFPKGFAFGSAISAYQWEGATNEDGRKPSIWDTFAHTRTKENGDTACDGYHKYKEDVQLMAETGLDNFRISISWSRLIPNGRGHVNPKGLQFYKNLIQELVINGIEPHATLFHYDLPQSLEDEYGGWRSRRIIKDFTAYANVCFREFGNSVKFWNTINEANIFTIGGYDDGVSAPGRCSLPDKNCLLGNSSSETYIVGHNLLLAHASASRLYKKKYKDVQGGSVGFSIYAIGFMPSTNSKDDEIAMQRARDFYSGWMLRPLIYGDYPDEMKRTVGSRLPVFTKEESEQVKGSTDFIGIVHYIAAIVSSNKLKPSTSGITDFYSDLGVSMTCRAMKQDSQLELKDTQRVEYLDAYIGAVLKAIRNGSDTRGYFVWSFMDMYELLSGYESCFGLYYVNFSDPHLKRSPKLSAHWYSAFLKGNNNFLGSQSIMHLQSNFSSSS
ncbi:unnamed protein product [Arabis nemorensis]|uniref:beta-glucosidase n=1 Tax=Arabis nemorensis TaxID=586526 RepID=A0A565CTE8_9BRAS|nr:unnamed protein product [Arabis nemorensis]